jgi:hypothetical protein
MATALRRAQRPTVAPERSRTRSPSGSELSAPPAAGRRRGTDDGVLDPAVLAARFVEPAQPSRELVAAGIAKGSAVEADRKLAQAPRERASCSGGEERDRAHWSTTARSGMGCYGGDRATGRQQFRRGGGFESALAAFGGHVERAAEASAANVRGCTRSRISWPGPGVAGFIELGRATAGPRRTTELIWLRRSPPSWHECRSASRC